MTMISDEIRIPGTAYHVMLKDRSLFLTLRNRTVDVVKVSESEREIYKVLDRLLSKHQVYVPKQTLKDIASKLLSSYRLVAEEKKPEETVTAKDLALRSMMRRTSKQAVIVNGPKELIKLELSKLVKNEEEITTLLSSYDSAFAKLNVSLQNEMVIPLIFANWNKLLDVVDTAKIILLIDSDDTGVKVKELLDAIKGFREKTKNPFVLIIHRDEAGERAISLDELKEICDSNDIAYYENVHISDILDDLKRLLDTTEDQVHQMITVLNSNYLGKLIEEKQKMEEKEKLEKESEESVVEEEQKIKEEKKKKKGFFSKIFGKD